MAYATLSDAKLELDTTATTDDTTLLRFLDIASRRIDNILGFPLEPRIMTRRFFLRSDLVNSRLGNLYLDMPMLALTAVTVYNTALTIGTNVELWPSGFVPSTVLHLKSTEYDWYRTWYDSSYSAIVTVTGLWGYHPDYDYAWQTEDLVKDAAGISASVNEITVTDADGADWLDRTPRFSAGQLLRIEAEYVRVTAVDTTTNKITVRRGVNGSTAALHALDTPIYVYSCDDVIRHGVARQAGLLYKRQGAFDQPQGDFGGIAYPSDLLAELRDILQGYAMPNEAYL